MNRSFRRIFCLNLARSTERWAYVSQELGRFRVDVERFEAVDGTTLRFEDLVAEGLLSAGYFHERSSGAFGVIATSAALWKRIAASEPGWYLILEDDVRLHPALLNEEVWDTYWKSVPADAEFVYLGCSSPWLNGPADDEITLLHYATPMNRYCVRVQKTIQGSYAYAITPYAARVLLERYLPLATPIDYFPPTLFPFYALRRVAEPWSELTPPGFYPGQRDVGRSGDGATARCRRRLPVPEHHRAWRAGRDGAPPAAGEAEILARTVRQIERFAENPRDWRALDQAGSSCRGADRHELAYLLLDAALGEAKRREPTDPEEAWARDFSCRDDLSVSAFYAHGGTDRAVGVEAMRDLFLTCLTLPREQ